MIQVNNPYPQFFDADGDPLDNGKVYFGVKNLDPRTNPKAVYSDYAGTTPVTQPIRTQNGYLVNGSGAPIAVYVDGDHSIAVYTSADVLLWSAPDSAQYNIEQRSIAAASLVYSDIASTASGKGADIVGFKQLGAGAVSRTASSKMRERVSVKDYGAVGDGVADDTTSINAAITYAATIGGEVFFNVGIYKTTSQINVPRNIVLRGEATPFPVAAYNPTQRTVGVVIVKAHGENGISVVGSGAYSDSGAIIGITVVSNYATFTTGDGIVIDKVGTYTIEQCNVWSCGGNGFTIGVTSGDQTGQILLRNLYVNNCNGIGYKIRSKWLKAFNVMADGCSWGMYLQDAPEALVNSFHFEGFKTGGIKLAGGSGWCSFIKGFVSMTATTPYKCIDIDDYPGNTDTVFDQVKCLGRNLEPGVIGAFVGAGAWRTRFSNCYFSSFPNAIQFYGKESSVSSSNFDNNFIHVIANANGLKISGNCFMSTGGDYCIDHVSGGGGIWSGNSFDKGINPGLFSGTTGNFGTNIVKNNTGFKTQARGISTAITSGTAIPHGLSVTPQTVFASPVSPFTLPASFTLAFDGTNITPSWSGGGSIQICWEAYATCANQG